MSRNHRSAWAGLLVALLLLVPPGCGDDDGGTGPRPPVDSVSLLLVVDNSGSAWEEQVDFGPEVQRLVGALLTGDVEHGTPDADPSDPDFPPVVDLHVGVVSTDMGAGGLSVESCDGPRLGDDGVLQNRGIQHLDDLRCRAEYDRFLTFGAGDRATCVADLEACRRLTEDAVCLALLGLDGCGFEQPLESMLKAVMPDVPSCTAPFCTFLGGTGGHGVDPATNGGFLRPRDLLAVVVLSSEDDCSAADPDLYDGQSARYYGQLTLRCVQYPTALQPIHRYVEGLAFTLGGEPGRLFFGVIAGVPQTVLEGAADRATGTVDLDAVLSAPEMTAVRPNADRTGLLPSCVSTRGNAKAPRRLVQVAQELQDQGATVAVGSVCAPMLSTATDTILRQLGDRLALSTAD